jgi:elongation of very long chain fatty acids protein 4
MAATTVFAKQVVSTLSKYGETYLLPYVNSLEQEARSLVKTYNPTLVSEYDAVLKTGDSLSKNFPLMNPFHVALILVGYLVIVFGGKFLMSFKKNPFSPKLLQIVHNALLVAVSAFMTFETINQWYSLKMGLFQNPVDHKNGQGLARIIWIFYFSKILEFMDTFIMVLKKSDRQISFLHVYHHTTIFAIWWAVTKWGPGGEAYYSVILNSFVHVVMYGYYLSTTVGFPLSFIKPYITSMQMLQFVLMMVQSGFDLAMGCKGYPTPLIALLFGYMITLLMLFANFFIKDRKRAAAERKAKAAGGKKTQ